MANEVRIAEEIKPYLFAESDITIYPTFTKFSWSIDQSIGAYTALGHKQLQLQEVRN